MSAEGIPKDVVDFVTDSIESVVQLEVLLLLHAERNRDWRASEIAKELRIDTAWTEDALAMLAARGTLQRNPDSYRYAPQSQPLDQTIAKLAQAYEERRVSTISLIFSKPPADPIRKFTDAFRFRPEEGKPPEQGS